MKSLAPDFIDRIIGVYGQAGQKWLDNLSFLQLDLAQRWSLSGLEPVIDLSYNYLVFAAAANGQPVVLKIGVPNPELTSEIQALISYEGNGAVKLLDADPDQGALLLERLLPGADLRSIQDDEKATRIAASLMEKLWHPVTHHPAFHTAADWCRGFQRYREVFPTDGPLPVDLLNQAANLASDLLANPKEQLLLHGDLHHMNILRGKDGWTAIDPKGVIGEPAFEIGSYLFNPYPDLIDHPHLKELQMKRIEIFTESLGLDKERMWAWSFVRGILGAIWSIEDGENWDYALEIARILRDML